jgi:hypothetical protein
VVAGIRAIQDVIPWDSIGTPKRGKTNNPSETRNRPSSHTGIRALENQGLRRITPKLGDDCEIVPLEHTEP